MRRPAAAAVESLRTGPSDNAAAAADLRNCAALDTRRHFPTLRRTVILSEVYLVLASARADLFAGHITA